MSRKSYFTSEHVSPGHPDKTLDAMAEAIVDSYLDQDPKSRIAVDGLFKGTKVMLAGEITSHANVDKAKLVKETFREIGFRPEVYTELNFQNLEVIEMFSEQSPDIAQGVNQTQLGAGDIGIMFGGAVKEAPDLTCHSHYLARKISYHVYKDEAVKLHSRPDQKTQVTIRYEDGRPVGIATVVCCVSHHEDYDQVEFKGAIAQVVDAIVAEYAAQFGLALDEYNLIINPTGAFVQCSAVADSGEVGRKIVCDQYGGYYPVGGGNLNGKCPSKVDRSAVYAARHAAKQLVEEGYATNVQIQLSYAIGMPQPISVDVECFGTNTKSMEEIDARLSKIDFSVAGIIERFQLTSKDRQFRYKDLGMYGHIGERFDQSYVLPWEVVSEGTKVD